MADDWILTYTGRRYWPASPVTDHVCAEDIARGLSLTCRFAGQCQHFYSVAEHSINVMRLVPQEHKLCALLHDAPEAYLGDMSRPLKARCRTTGGPKLSIGLAYARNSECRTTCRSAYMWLTEPCCMSKSEFS